MPKGKTSKPDALKRGGSSRTRTRAPSPDAHWTARFVYVHMKLHNMTQAEFLNLSGFPRTTFQRWWKGESDPRVSEVEACLNVFGYGLKPTPIPDDPKEK